MLLLSNPRAAHDVDAQLAARHGWVATAGDRLVSFSGLNAALPDIVQLGGVYTPPELSLVLLQ